MIITNISNAILRNTQNLAKVSIFGGFAYGFIQTMKSGESALVPTSRWVSSHVLSSSQHKGGKEGQNTAGEEKAEATTVLRRHHQNDGPSSSVRGEGVESSDIERRRVNASVAWSSMRWDTKLSLACVILYTCKKRKEREGHDEYVMNIYEYDAVFCGAYFLDLYIILPNILLLTTTASKYLFFFFFFLIV